MAAHHQILRYAQKHALKDTPRTTLVAAVVQGGLAQWAHCGDSRLYFLRDNRLVERTRDHSYLEQYRDAPVPPNKPVPTNRNVLYTCLGSPVKPVFDVSAVMPLQQGDKVLLCSDGVWGNLDEAELVQLLGSEAVPVSAAQLVDRALLQGGATCDNATLVAFEWETPSDDALTQAATLDDALDETGFSSTVQADALQEGGLGDDFSDEDIERSIAEINEAIRRTAARKH